MCEFVSWIEFEGSIYFLMNADIETKEGKELLKPEYIADLCGHGAIRHYYPELIGKGNDKEFSDFSSQKNFPSEIALAIKQGKMSNIGVCPDVLNKEGLKKYVAIQKPAWEKYVAIEKPAWEKYEAIEKPARGKYVAIQKPAREKYVAIQKLAWEKYDAIEKPAWEKYDAIEKPAWEKYEAIKISAREKYVAIEKPAMAEYEDIKISAFNSIVKQKKYRCKAWK